jgi:hypothetical protein
VLQVWNGTLHTFKQGDDNGAKVLSDVHKAMLGGQTLVNAVTLMFPSKQLITFWVSLPLHNKLCRLTDGIYCPLKKEELTLETWVSYVYWKNNAFVCTDIRTCSGENQYRLFTGEWVVLRHHDCPERCGIYTSKPYILRVMLDDVRYLDDDATKRTGIFSAIAERINDTTWASHLSPLFNAKFNQGK